MLFFGLFCFIYFLLYVSSLLFWCHIQWLIYKNICTRLSGILNIRESDSTSNYRKTGWNLAKFFLWAYFLTSVQLSVMFLTWIINDLKKIILWTGKIRIVFQDNSSKYGISLTVFQDYIFAAFSERNEIVRANKTSGRMKTFHSTNNPVRGPHDVFAYDKSRQPAGSACVNAHCEQLCLPTGEERYR